MVRYGHSGMEKHKSDGLRCDGDVDWPDGRASWGSIFGDWSGPQGQS